MESLVVGLFDEVVDPAVVPLHGSEASKMSAHAADHAGDAGNSLEEEASGDPFGFGHFIGIIPGEVVVGFSDELDGLIGDFVFEGLGLEVLVLDFLGFGHGIGVVGHSVAEGVVDSTVFGEDVVELFESFENCGFHFFPGRINYGKSDRFGI